MKLSTRLFVFSSLLLLMLPVSAYYFIGSIEKTILQGQQEAQSMTAAAIANVVQGYTDLFELDEDALYVYPLKNNLSIDAYISDDEDWAYLSDRFSHYENFSLLLADDESYLYAYLKVTDSDVVYRNPRYVPLDSSDHIRIEYIDSEQQQQRLVLLAEGQGNVSIYRVKENWQTWTSGQHISAVYAVWNETPQGYDVELRIPKKWLGPERRLSISIVNVFDENERNIDTVVTTQVLNGELLNPLLVRSGAISSAIKNIDVAGSQICVIDKFRRVRAVIGGAHLEDALCQATDKVHDDLVAAVLTGKTVAQDEGKAYGRHADADRVDESLIVAVQPVFHEQEIVGAVLVSSSRQQILSSQRETLWSIMLVSLVMFLLIILSLLLFSSRLAFRLNRLKAQTSSLIDKNGRFVNNADFPANEERDEIGELSRSFSLLLERLNRYTCFLETVPKMLRHEILNPVNTISMSLQNLSQRGQQTDQSNGMDLSAQENTINIADDAIKQLQLIVSGLTEAANIEQALKQDEIESIDLAALLSEYVSNSQLRHKTKKLCYIGQKSGVSVLANDTRIVQLIDKLKDNALDFSSLDTEIVFQLDVNQRHQVVISVKNEGETIPQAQLDTLFSGMVSHRTQKTAVPHLGIGLYVAFQIVKHHQGELIIANRKDKHGVEASIILPTVK